MRTQPCAVLSFSLGNANESTGVCGMTWANSSLYLGKTNKPPQLYIHEPKRKTTTEPRAFVCLVTTVSSVCPSRSTGIRVLSRHPFLQWSKIPLLPCERKLHLDLEHLGFCKEQRKMTPDCHIVFCSYYPRRHTGRNLQPSETDHRGTIWALHLGSSKGKIMKTDFCFPFSNWYHPLHLTTLKPFQWSLPLVPPSVVHTLTITFCSSHNALNLMSLLV